MMDFSDYIGIPFESKGRSHTGLDCWGLIRLVYKEELCIDLPSYLNEYANVKERNAIAKATEVHSVKWLKIEHGKEKTFDVILLVIRGLPIHIGMVVRPGYMLHVLDKLQTCIERYNTPLWSKRIRGFYRYAR